MYILSQNMEFCKILQIVVIIIFLCKWIFLLGTPSCYCIYQIAILKKIQYTYYNNLNYDIYIHFI